jgi:hypothetical protein
MAMSLWASSGCIEIDVLCFAQGDGDGDPRFPPIDVGDAVAEPSLMGGFVGEGYVKVTRSLSSG